MYFGVRQSRILYLNVKITQCLSSSFRATEIQLFRINVGYKIPISIPKKIKQDVYTFFRKNWWKLSKVYMISLRMVLHHAKYGSSQPVLFCKKRVSGICKIHRKTLMMESFLCNAAGLQQLCLLKNCAKIFRTNFL